ncbi:hypothetical protein, partial [Dickeya solani]|uniref:hypothetical protein n=1 Tax=Dickeya solani TaxID=1089444 RepID=UPI0022A6C304
MEQITTMQLLHHQHAALLLNDQTLFRVTFTPTRQVLLTIIILVPQIAPVQQPVSANEKTPCQLPRPAGYLPHHTRTP